MASKRPRAVIAHHPNAQLSASWCLKVLTFPPKLNAAAAKTLVFGKFSGKPKKDRTVSWTWAYSAYMQGAQSKKATVKIRKQLVRALRKVDDLQS